MKISNFLTAAASVALPYTSAQQRAEKRGLFHLDESDHDHSIVVFEECVGTHLTQCKEYIASAVTANPDLFHSVAELDYDVLPVRSSDTPDYYKVGLRTDNTEQYVAGVLDDSMVFYPFDWCTTAYDCNPIGPWNCDVGSPLTVEACCDLIKADITEADVNGNTIDCFADLPVGSVSKPIDHHRVCIHVDENNIVIHPPRNE